MTLPVIDGAQPLGQVRRRSVTARRALPEERPAVLTVLQSAFHDDPLYQWLVPHAESRAARLQPLFDVLLDAASSCDAVWVLDDLSAAAVWADHAAEVITQETVDRYLQQLASTLRPAELAAATETMPACAEHAPATAHAVLHSIAVPQHARGTGAGSMLLGQLPERSDRSGVAVYLESSNARNQSFYARHGFRALGTVPLPGGRAGMTPMLRQVPAWV